MPLAREITWTLPTISGSILISELKQEGYLALGGSIGDAMEPQVWRLIAHHEAGDLAIQRSKEASRIAIGWGKIGDLNRYSADATEIADAIRSTYPGLNNSGQGGQCLLRFAHQIRKGDLVIISDGVRRREVAQITGDYNWTKDWSPIPDGDYWHQRATKFWSASPPDDLWKECGGAVASGENIRWTLARLSKRVQPIA